ncbi:hypothetical protein NQZ68_016954 [Dissostichus eleginoides]|nr:hypothetical protein NQZ68_016954 [Dissostichus eleginoides]
MRANRRSSSSSLAFERKTLLDFHIYQDLIQGREEDPFYNSCEPEMLPSSSSSPGSSSKLRAPPSKNESEGFRDAPPETSVPYF